MEVFDRAIEDGGEARVYRDATTCPGGSPEGGVQILKPRDLDDQVTYPPKACSRQDRGRGRGLPPDATSGLGQCASRCGHGQDEVRSLTRGQGREIEGEGTQADP
jgi:hypothetical protein